MAQQFPCDIDGICLACQTHPREQEKLQCVKCVTFWHMPCLSMDLPTAVDDTVNWICSDCLNMERSFVPFTRQVHDTASANQGYKTCFFRDLRPLSHKNRSEISKK